MGRRAFAGWALALVAAGVLAGCSGTADTPGTTGRAATTPTEMDVEAAWLDGGRMIGVVTWGSSGCVPTAGDVALADDGTLTVELSDAAATEGERACTADYAPRVSGVGVPEGVDPTQPLTVTVSLGGAEGTTILAGVTGLPAPAPETDYLPSAGWTGQPGMLAYVTWGSSTCVPAVQDAAVTGEAQVTVVFQEPAADRMCTMDMVSRPGLVEVSGLAAPVGAQLVLTGDAFDNVTVPILGGA
jgi:hypothetical protein